MTRFIRPIRIEGQVAYVLLTRGYEAMIDAEDVHLVENYNWWASSCGGLHYAVRTGPRPMQKKSYMHREIMDAQEGFCVDHINGNGLDNRKSNLRVCTHSQNQRNQGTPRHNSSGFKGVCWSKDKQKWQAGIKINGKNKFLGRYETPEEAHKAYCDASAKYHGAFGKF